MASYLDLDVGSLDAEQVRQDGRDYLTANAPSGWAINPWVDWLLGAVARMAVLVLTLAGQVPRSIFAAFLTEVLGITQITAAAATGTVTVHASSGAGGTIAAGAQIDIDGQAFVSTSSATISAASTGTVSVQAVTAGTAGNDLSTATLVAPSLVWVDSLTLATPTANGTDGETDDEFVDRGADELPTLSPKAVLIADAAAIARADIEVYRALAIDNFVPPSTSGVAGAITVAQMTSTGANTTSDAKTRVQAALEDGRILNIDAHVIDPTRTAMDVAFTATAYPDQDPTVVSDAAKQAVADFLSPLGWGVPPGADATAWVDETVVQHNDLIGVLYKVPGIRHVASVTLGSHGGSLSTSDFTLTGPAAVPTITLADIAATVT